VTAVLAEVQEIGAGTRNAIILEFSSSLPLSSRFDCKTSISITRRTVAKMPKADSPTGFKQLKDTSLFTPFKLGPIQLEHRIVQAPLTRMRATKESEGVTVPNDLNVEYFSQRASKGGLQLTEATDIAKFVSNTKFV
jgi:hypothetical protein